MQKWLNRIQPSESGIQGGAAILVGLLSGAGVWLFKQLINLFQLGAFGWLGGKLAIFGGWTIVLIPIIGGVLVGLLSLWLIGEEKLHGVAGVMEAVALSGGRLPYRTIVAKSVASALSIGTGASVGPEDPAVQIGANIGSFFGQILHLSEERVRTLVAAGVASGISAAFNAPITGVFFAMEIVLGEIGGNSLSMVVIASVISAFFTQAVSGAEPAFHVPSYAFNSTWELPLYLGLGLAAGLFAATYTRLLYAAQDGFQAIHVPGWVKPAIAGAIVGMVGFFLPQIFGVGYEAIGAVLNGAEFGFTLLVLLLTAKLILTPVSLGGGFKGGLFAPSLFIGAMLGGAYGTLMAWLFPNLGITPAAFAMVGMAAVLAGSVHAPFTAILLLFEMTRDYHIILPLMFAVIISMLISRRLERDSVYARGLARHGIRLERGRDVEVLETMTVGEVMQTEPATLNENNSIAEASEIFLKQRHHGLPVVNETGELVGVLTLQDLDQVNPAEWSTHTVGATCSHDLLVTYPDEAIGEALRRMGRRDVGRLPVVDRDHPRKLLGLLRRTDLVRAYEAALTRREAKRHHEQETRLDAMTGNMMVNEYIIHAGAPCDGKILSKAGFPQGCIIASLRRGRETLIPRGDTVLKAKDVLTIVATPGNKDKILRLIE